MIGRIIQWIDKNFKKRWIKVIIYLGFLLLLASPFFLNRFISGEKLEFIIQTMSILPIILLIFILFFNFIPYLLSDSFRKGGFHLLILTITILSFYAFGWPENLTQLEEKFSELAVTLVLFILAELAVLLTFHAGEMGNRIEETGSQVIIQIDEQSKRIYEAADNASTRIESSVQPVLEAQERLKGLADRMDSAASQVAVALTLISNVNKCNDAFFADHLLKQLSVYSSAWSQIIAELKQNIKDNTTDERVRCWAALLETYIKEEIIDIYGKPVQIRDIRGRERHGIRVPSLATNEDMYLKLLDALAKTVEPIAHREGRHPIFRAITNILPSEWYNWPLGVNRYCQYRYIEEYTRTAKEILKKSNVDFKRMVVVFDDRLAQGNSDTETRKYDLRERTGVRMASDLVEDCLTRFYLSIRVNADSEDIEPFYDPNFLNNYFRENLFDTSHLQVDDRVYPIIRDKHKNILDKLSAEDYLHVDEFGIYYLKKISMYDYYIGDLHQKEDDALVGLLERKEELEMLPNAAPDMLMVGYLDENHNKEKWLMAVSSTLKVGQRTMQMQIMSDQERLDDIEVWWHRLSKLGRLKPLKAFLNNR
ncbi:MAG: hypothetical protein DA329_10595 [Candidatus Nitrosocosmicus sp.]|nr:hypothetical protein [Candidatus Nitrosocosmicus sp.]